MAKATRSSTDLKALVADLCNNEEFLQKIFEHVSKNITKMKLINTDTDVKCISQNKANIEQLKEENAKLKIAVEKLKSEVTLLKTKQQEGRSNAKTVNTDKKSSMATAYVDVQAQPQPSQTVVEIVEIAPSTSRMKPVAHEAIEERNVAAASEKEFVRVSKRRKNKPEQKIGAAKEDKSGGLLIGTGQAKTAWFYVGKIKNKEATKSDMLDYLKQNDKDVDFIVEKL